MVERLKDAIIKARERREVGASAPVTPPPPAGGSSQPADELRDAMLAAVSRGPGAATGAARRMPVDEEWASLPQLTLNPARLDQHRIVSYRKSHPAHLGFDMLRTRLLNVLRTNGWNRLAITSPTKNCGKTNGGAKSCPVAWPPKRSAIYVLRYGHAISQRREIPRCTGTNRYVGLPTGDNWR